MGTGGAQTKEQLVVEAYDWKDTAKLIVVIRNVGSAEVTLAAAYIEGAAAPGGPTGLPADKVAIGLTISYTLTMPLGFTPTSGASYVLKLATLTGGTFTFSCVAGKAG